MKRNKNTIGVLAISTIGAVTGTGHAASAHEERTSGPTDAQSDCGTYSGEGCAPLESRIDLELAQFSNPTEITNQWFPISELESAVLTGTVDDLPFRSETTLLPYTGFVVINGERIEVALSQYMAYSDGRITEVAIDRYAQADDGSVWYLGEDVYDYAEGTIVVSEGTWLAGRDGPAAMIMSGDPQVGQAFRPEQIPGIVFEEVTIAEIGVTADGPFGPVEGAIVTSELHLDGTTSDKLFAPGYGEFYTGHDGDVEALSVAVSTDRVDEAEPSELAELLTGTWGLVESARLEEWEAVDATLARITDDWNAVAAGPVPVRIADTMTASLATLTEAVATQDSAAVTNAAVDVAQSALDIALLYRPASSVDVERFHLHSQQLRIDAAAVNAAGVASEVATLEWLRDRIAGSVDADELATIDAKLAELRAASNTGNLAAAADQAARLTNDVRTFSADALVADDDAAGEDDDGAGEDDDAPGEDDDAVAEDDADDTESTEATS